MTKRKASFHYNMCRNLHNGLVYSLKKNFCTKQSIVIDDDFYNDLECKL